MLRLRACLVALSFVIVAAAMVIPAQAQQILPDSSLYTQYQTNHPPNQFTWITCGRLPLAAGCFAAGTLGPFTDACAIVQSVPLAINAFTVVRYIYVLDTGTTTHDMTLTAYKRTDTVSQSNDVVNITTVAVVALPNINGGSGATCAMVQNPTNVYAATFQGPGVAMVHKANYTVDYTGSFGATVNSLTADSYGYVIMNWTTNLGPEYSVYGPDGQTQMGGMGNWFMINPIDAVYPDTIPGTGAAALPQVHIVPR